MEAANNRSATGYRVNRYLVIERVIKNDQNDQPKSTSMGQFRVYQDPILQSLIIDRCLSDVYNRSTAIVYALLYTTSHYLKHWLLTVRRDPFWGAPRIYWWSWTFVYALITLEIGVARTQHRQYTQSTHEKPAGIVVRCDNDIEGDKLCNVRKQHFRHVQCTESLYVYLSEQTCFNIELVKLNQIIPRHEGARVE